MTETEIAYRAAINSCALSCHPVGLALSWRRRRTQRASDPQARTGEECCRLVEDHTERLGSERAMWGADRSQGDIELAIGDADVAGGDGQLMQHAPS